MTIPPSFRHGFYGGLLVAFILAIWLVQLWSGEKQVRLHSEHLLRQVERQDWSAVEDFLASDYHDSWGDDRAELLRRLRLASLYLPGLTITPTQARIRTLPREGWWQARIQLEARGEGAAEARTRINSLTTPFVLHWRQVSWKPWDWKLLEVTNPELTLPAG